ncbi:hypothetical protein Tco_0331477 [Tanacetum coccineum]
MEAVAVVGEVEARGSEWIWGSGRSGHEDNIWFRPERSPENFSGGGGMVAGGGGRREGWPDIWGRWRRERGLKPKPITDVKLHPNYKPTVLTVYRNNDKRNFQVHIPFKFTDFRVNELDELGPIIQKKKNKTVKALMLSLGKRYERLENIPKELGIQSALPAPAPNQALCLILQK